MESSVSFHTVTTNSFEGVELISYILEFGVHVHKFVTGIKEDNSKQSLQT
jgi:hypothetical protein